MTRLRMENIGELFTGDFARPVSDARAIDIEDGRIVSLGAPSSGEYAVVIDAREGGILPGIVMHAGLQLLLPSDRSLDASGLRSVRGTVRSS